MIPNIPYQTVERQGEAHYCTRCGWAGQPVTQVLSYGCVVYSFCVDEEMCEWGSRLAEHLDDLAVEQDAASARAEAGLGWE